MSQKFLWDSNLNMRSSLVVRASDCQCWSRNSPGFDPVLRIRVHIYLGLPDPEPDPLVRGMDTDLLVRCMDPHQNVMDPQHWFDPSILPDSGIWEAADEAVLNTVHSKKIQKNPPIKTSNYLDKDLLWVFLDGAVAHHIALHALHVRNTWSRRSK